MHTLPNLSPAITREVYATLCSLLPPPSPDTPETRAQRADAAMAAVAALYPGDAFEADLAATIVGAGAHARDCMRLAARAAADGTQALRCRAQASSMMRLQQTALRALEQRQDKRERELDKLTPYDEHGRPCYTHRDISVPEPEPAPPASPEPPEPSDQPQPPAFEAMSEAEQYAVLYPDRAARIRAARGLPQPLTFGPPEPELVAAIVHGTSPVLRALDACLAATV